MTATETLNIVYRRAVPEDAVQCIAIRGKTRENAFSEAALNALGITEVSWAGGIADNSLPGHVCCADGKMVGYCFGDRDSGEVVVLALLPEFEGAGIGKNLLRLMVNDFREQGVRRLFLGCATDPAVRSYGFYRHLGWKPTGQYDDLGDEILELLLD